MANTKAVQLTLIDPGQLIDCLLKVKDLIYIGRQCYLVLCGDGSLATVHHLTTVRRWQALILVKFTLSRSRRMATVREIHLAIDFEDELRDCADRAGLILSIPINLMPFERGKIWRVKW